MKTIECTNGVKLTYDDTIKVGDIITAYYAGYHEVTEITERKGGTPLFHFKMVFNSSGKPSKAKKIKACDASYCRRASEGIDATISQAEELFRSLTRLKEIVTKS